MKVIEIKKGWFRSAGNVYHWTDEAHVFGVGINMRTLMCEKYVGLIVLGKKYVLTSETGLAFIRKYESIKIIGGEKIGIVSLSILEDLDTAIKNKKQPKLL